MPRLATNQEEVVIAAAVARLRAAVMAIVCGLLAGTGLWVATLWLVLRGGEQVGLHLGLLRYYFPGYSVTVAGAFIGFLWASLAGAAAGWLAAWAYNRIVDLRAGR